MGVEIPTLSLTDSLDAKIRSIGWNHKSAAVDLVRLIQGHSTDINLSVNCVSGFMDWSVMAGQ